MSASDEENLLYGLWETNDETIIQMDDENVPNTEPQKREESLTDTEPKKGKKNVPDTTFLKAERKDWYCTVCVPLYRAAIQGNWKAAKDVINKYPDAVRIAITENLETALHIAAAAKHTSFVKELVKVMKKSDLALVNILGNTAMCFAAVSGVVKIAETMVGENKNLTMIRGNNGTVTPLYFAVKLGHNNMASYLLKETKVKELSGQENIDLLFASISTDMYDVALKLLKNDPKLATARKSNKKGDTALHVFARKPQVLAESLLTSMGRSISSWIPKKRTKTLLAQELAQNLWEQVIADLPMSEISDLIRSPSNLLLDAAEAGNVGFIAILLQSYPDLLWSFDEKRGTIFHAAVKQRQESVFSLIYDIGAIKDLVAVKKNTKKKEKLMNSILHLAAELPPPSRLSCVPGAALQMQRELLWFQEVQNIVPGFIQQRRMNREIPREQFTKNHQELMKEGEKWMKDRATSCMVVATLIATMVFTAVFTVPGGNNSETGRPVLLKEQWFLVFIFSDMVGLFSSVISIVMFLSILTSRYAEQDFLVALPAKLIVGLSALFVSIASMLSAVVAAFFLVYNNEMSMVPVVVASFAYLVAISYIMLHLNMWIDIVRSTFFSRFIFKNYRLFK